MRGREEIQAPQSCTCEALEKQTRCMVMGGCRLHVPSGEEPFDSFIYDPRDPCPNIFDSPHHSGEGPFDQRPIERRNDVLVYSTVSLDKM